MQEVKKLQDHRSKKRFCAKQLAKLRRQAYQNKNRQRKAKNKNFLPPEPFS
jgi:hypothetical protein